MCGIIGYIGKENSLPIILNGLKALEYRGYDSAGIAYSKDNEIKIVKEKGKIAELEKILPDDYSNIGIGHTRWATHGGPSTINSHPHKVGSITIVHNGIIENYQELKEKLKKEKVKFISETDTEVACALINYFYEQTNNIERAIILAREKLVGSYAIGLMVEGEDKIYAFRKQSPLILGVGEEEFFIASDIPAFLEYTNKYMLLEEDEFAILRKDKIIVQKIISKNETNTVKKQILTFDFPRDVAKKGGYSHFMLKEINEEPNVCENLVNIFKEKDFDDLPDITKYHSIDIVACGSAYHAGMIGKYLIENYLEIPVTVTVASEYRYQKHINEKNKLVIAISQSGETADTIASIEIAKEHGYKTIGIVNVIGSTISRMVDKVLYIYAGPEIAVATTKAYTLQVLMLSLLTYKNARNNIKKNKILNEFQNLKNEIVELINFDYTNIVDKIYKNNDIFFIGRLLDYALCLEGSLKLKEISYIHSEAYQAGELKHGTISLIEDGTPVIAIVTDESIKLKTISNIKETKARGAHVLLIVKEGIEVTEDIYDDKIVIPNNSEFIMPILSIVPLQLLAYYVALKRGCDIDKPKNLAKSVTVE